MSQKIVFNIREFTKELQQQIKLECETNHYVWDGFEHIDLIKKEIKSGQQSSEKILPQPLHEHIRYYIDPIDYRIEFYLSIGYEE